MNKGNNKKEYNKKQRASHVDRAQRKAPSRAASNSTVENSNEFSREYGKGVEGAFVTFSHSVNRGGMRKVEG